MATFAELKTRVSSNLQDENNEGISAANVGLAINQAIKFYSETIFYFSDEVATVNLTINDPVIPALPSDFDYLNPNNALEILYSESKYKVFQRSPTEYDAVDDEGRGLPAIWTFKGGQYLIYPYPDQAYPLQVSYYRSYVDLVDDSDTNAMTIQADVLIENRATARLAKTKLQDNDLASAFEFEETRELLRLKRKTRKMKQTGLKVETILNQCDY